MVDAKRNRRGLVARGLEYHPIGSGLHPSLTMISILSIHRTNRPVLAYPSQQIVMLLSFLSTNEFPRRWSCKSPHSIRTFIAPLIDTLDILPTLLFPKHIHKLGIQIFIRLRVFLPST